jgi:hypothetical protein
MVGRRDGGNPKALRVVAVNYLTPSLATNGIDHPYNKHTLPITPKRKRRKVVTKKS